MGCEEHNVDIMFTGHDHNLQHITKTSNVDVDYVVSGAGARSLYEYDSANEDTIRGLGFKPIFFGYQYGFVGVTITSSEILCEYFTYILDGDNIIMEKIYEFSRYRV